MSALTEVSKVWVVAKMVHTLFESILGNKHLEERLQKAAGNRHKKRPAPRPHPASPPMKEHSNKRKFDDVDAAFGLAQPAPQMSYERSRPQTPAITPSREIPPQVVQPNIIPTHETGEIPRQDAFMGHSRGGTRMHSPTTGVPGMSYPGTPPDLFLVTRNSPTIPEDLWTNFQPDQLFPADAGLNFSPPTNTAMIDPQLAHAHHPPGIAPPHMQSPPGPGQPQMQHLGQQQQQQSMGQPQYPHMAHLQPNGAPMMQQQQSPHSWAQVGAMNARPQFGHEDTWSNSSVGGQQAPVVPTTLNVEEW